MGLAIFYLTGCSPAPSLQGSGGMVAPADDPLEQEQILLMTAAASGAQGRATQAAAFLSTQQAEAEAAAHETRTVAEALLIQQQMAAERQDFDLESTRIASEAQATL